MIHLYGIVERITYCNPQSGFVVLRLRVEGEEELCSLIGRLPPVQVGEGLACEGKWITHPSHGRQFEVASAEVRIPATLQSIEAYLGSGQVKGIGPVYAKKICAAFGMETLKILDEAPEQLKTIPGIGPKRLEELAESWKRHRNIREVMLFLHSHGITPAFSHKLIAKYGPQTLEILKTNPYALSEDLAGVGFRRADQIAKQMGMAEDAPQRLQAALLWQLDLLQEAGHTCAPHTLISDRLVAALALKPEGLAAAVAALVQEKRIEEKIPDGMEEPYLWKRPLYLSEMGIAQELDRLQRGTSFLRSFDLDAALEWAEKKLQLILAPAQRDAVREALSNKVQIITGGPGTGKSTIIRLILAIMSQLTRRIALAAPTGRAAKRMSEITGYHASTLHALLEWDPEGGGFKRGRHSPLEQDLLIVDEVSMLDTSLCSFLLKAIGSSCRLILVGDVDQLPSIGPGAILRDLIDSEKIPTQRLTKIFRQAAGSQMVVNAHRIRRGLMPHLSEDPQSDFLFYPVEEAEEMQKTLLHLISYELPSSYPLDPIRDIQVLSPMRRGPVGIDALNRALQERLNPSKEPLFYYDRRFHLHDKVMQLRNNYELGIMNGDVGRILAIDHEKGELLILFDGERVLLTSSDLKYLTPAYAVSGHKYQGSECPCACIPLTTSHAILLDRYWLYTAVTRPRRLCLLVGSRKALAMALHKQEGRRRQTGLMWALHQQLA